MERYACCLAFHDVSTESEKVATTNSTPAAETPAEAPKELSKSQLKKLAKQKNAKPKMSKEEKMKAVWIGWNGWWSSGD